MLPQITKFINSHVIFDKKYKILGISLSLWNGRLPSVPIYELGKLGSAKKQYKATSDLIKSFVTLLIKNFQKDLTNKEHVNIYTYVTPSNKVMFNIKITTNIG